jgi:Zn-dependent oligopeptidase
MIRPLLMALLGLTDLRLHRGYEKETRMEAADEEDTTRHELTLGSPNLQVFFFFFLHVFALTI